MRTVVAGVFSALCLSAFAAFAGVPNVSKVTPVTPGAPQGGCPKGTTLKFDAKRRLAACVPDKATPPLSRRRAAAPPSNKNCPKPTPGSKVAPKC